jgi:predicted ATPase/class 3 adenylate cyclase
MSVSPNSVPAEVPPLPSGTVTFVFTDIEGSTRRWDRDRSAMQAAVRRHDELVRAAIAEHRGHVFKTIGDAFCAAFARAEDAVAAILVAQRALAAEDFSAVDGIRVRVAIHTGTADERDGDYFGPALNRVARLLAIGYGGQVLVSGVTAELVQGSLPPGASLRDLGEHHLRDLTRPEHVYQLFAPGLIADFPPLRSVNDLQNNLPQLLTSFIGREQEIAEVTALVREHRLVTFVGSGGVGKTRTSLEVAANLLGACVDGVWFIELAPLSRGEYIPTTLAQTIGLTLPPQGDPLESLIRALNNKTTLLVFDNCEHLVESAARVVAAILHGCPNVKVIASSRESLDISGEQTYRLPSLSVPTTSEPAELSAVDALRAAAVTLFVERARAVDKRFALTDENAPAVADICRRLDGIPLAIELAAARIKMLNPRQLRERLDERFRVLTGGSRDVLPRQQTLRALIDWSYDLLDDNERRLFRRLAIFVNGFTLEGANAVGGEGDFGDVDIFDVLASLVDKSLVLAEPSGDSLRYRLLESTRAYALEKLDAAGERATLAGRHLHYMRGLFVALWERREQTGRTKERLDAIQTEREDLRSALECALASDVTAGAELLASVETSSIAFGESIARCEAFLKALPRDQPRLLAQISSALSTMLLTSGMTARGLDVATEAVHFGRQSGDAATLARALTRYATLAALANRLDEAEAAVAEAQATPETTTPNMRLSFLEIRALLSLYRGDFETAASSFEQLRKQFRALGNASEEVSVAINLAELEYDRGQTERAITIVAETLPIARAFSGKRLTHILVNLAGYLASVDDLPGAADASREVIEILSSNEPDHAHVTIALEHLALVFALRGEFARAATLEGYVDAEFARLGFERDHTEKMSFDRVTALLAKELAQDELARLIAAGSTLQPEAAIALALE